MPRKQNHTTAPTTHFYQLLPLDDLDAHPKCAKQVSNNNEPHNALHNQEHTSPTTPLHSHTHPTTPDSHLTHPNPAPAPAPAFLVHKVLPQDNLISLAIRYKSTEHEIMCANGMLRNDLHLYPLTELLIPYHEGAPLQQQQQQQQHPGDNNNDMEDEEQQMVIAQRRRERTVTWFKGATGESDDVVARGYVERCAGDLGVAVGEYRRRDEERKGVCGGSGNVRGERGKMWSCLVGLL